MTPAQQEAKRRAEVMLAFAEGKKIELADRNGYPKGPWEECRNPVWNWKGFDYQVAGEPEPVKKEGPKEWDTYLDPGGFLRNQAFTDGERLLHGVTRIRVVQLLPGWSMVRDSSFEELQSARDKALLEVIELRKEVAALHATGDYLMPLYEATGLSTEACFGDVVDTAVRKLKEKSDGAAKWAEIQDNFFELAKRTGVPNTVASVIPVVLNMLDSRDERIRTLTAAFRQLNSVRAKDYSELAYYRQQVANLGKFIGHGGGTAAHIVSEAVSLIEKLQTEARRREGTESHVDLEGVPQKPPLGIQPKRSWKEHRMVALSQAIARYSEAGFGGDLQVDEWMKELVELIPLKSEVDISR